MRVLHVIHDYLPRHRAGSEIYVQHLCNALKNRGIQIHILCAEYDPSQTHCTLNWREYEGLPIVELINNWCFGSFDETYQSALINKRLSRVLQVVQPDLLHIHNLLNLSLDLPILALACGIPSVATLHDFTLVCPNGGQRVRPKEETVCKNIDPNKCATCFDNSPSGSQMAMAKLGLGSLGGSRLGKFSVGFRRRFPKLAAWVSQTTARHVKLPSTLPSQVTTRLLKTKEVFETIDKFVAPSAALAADFQRFGLPAGKLMVSDYGFPSVARIGRKIRNDNILRIGFMGTLVWHKGLHVLLDEVRALPHDCYEVRVFGDPNTFPDYVASLRASARDLPVAFMGPFKQNKVGEIFGQFDLLVVPSLWPENSPLVIHEAFMAGVPVIGSRMGGIVDLVKHGKWGLLFDPWSHGELRAALRSVLEDKEILNCWRKALPIVRNIEDDATQWEATYREIMQG
ncbi:MAG: glycosyltransferase [Pseudomonadota bacterium]